MRFVVKLGGAALEDDGEGLRGWGGSLRRHGMVILLRLLGRKGKRREEQGGEEELRKLHDLS